MSLIDGEDERSYSTLNIFYFVLKFFFERKKKLDEYANELVQCIPTDRNRRENDLITTWYYFILWDALQRISLSVKRRTMSSTWSRQLCGTKKKTRETHGKIMQKVYAKLWCCGLLFVTTSFWLKIYLFLTQFGDVHNSANTLFVPSHNCVE